MKVLVTGGAGFIGSHLVERLLKEGNEVIVVDNYTLGKKENLASVLENKNLEIIECNIDETENFCEKLNDYDIDMIYHLAANSDIQKGGQNPDVDFRDTFMTTRSVLELMRRKDIKNLFFSSTSAIYGDKMGIPLKEDLGDLKPISYYGGAKFASEALISSYTHMNDLNVVMFRFPNVIGPHLTHGVIFDFKKKLERNPKELEILGDGTQQKPYVYVLDLIDAIMMLTKDIKKGIEIYNAGDETSTSVLTIANIVCEELGYKDVEYKFTGGNIGWKGDVPKFNFNLEKIHKAGWKASHTSDEAVRDTVRSIKN